MILETLSVSTRQQNDFSKTFNRSNRRSQLQSSDFNKPIHQTLMKKSTEVPETECTTTKSAQRLHQQHR